MPRRSPPQPGPRRPPKGAYPQTSQPVDVEGRRLVLRNLEKVLYPDTGTTKAELLAYLTAVAPALLAQLRDRPCTRIRWPHGVGDQSFFEKNAPAGVPGWVRTVAVTGSERVTYPVVDDLSTLIWLGNLAALELHVPQWRFDPQGAPRHPDRLVIDLDPGPPAGLAACAEVAHAVRELMAADGLTAHPVTSGGTGLQLYAAVSGEQPAEVLRDYARSLAESLQRSRPRLVVARMTPSLRSGKVFLDWSQNTAAKTTIAPYSPRGRALPVAAAPRDWAELDDGLRQLRQDEVVDRLAVDGDLLAPLLEPGPRVPERGPDPG